MNEQSNFWAGPFGDAYTNRNQVPLDVRRPFWRDMMHRMQPDTVLEIGCNRGHNLKLISEFRPYAHLYGVDVNTSALDEAAELGVADDLRCLSAQDIGMLFEENSIDLVFSAGVLIHIPPADIKSVIRAMADASGQYVLAIEYEDVEEAEVNYRGHANKLWRRPYGDLMHAEGISIIDSGPAIGFDQCTYWLGEKR